MVDFVKISDLAVAVSLVGSEMLEYEPDSPDENGHVTVDQLKTYVLNNLEAVSVLYDNSGSDLTATEVQAAIDELAGLVGSGAAIDVTYDNSTSGLTAVNVQAAIDEVVAMIGGGGGMMNPMTTEGDMIVGDTGGTPVRVGIGTNGQVLTSDGTTASWQNPTGGGGFLSVQDSIYKAIAEANMTITHGASGTLFDKKIDKGGFVILALAGSVRGTTFRAGTSYVVPTGKIAVVVDVKFDAQTLSNPTYYQHRLYNSTTTEVPAGPNVTIAGGTAADFLASGQYAGPWAQINVDIPYPTQAGVAGDTLRAEIAGGPDSNDRPTAGLYVLAIIDASTHQIDPVTA